jgi:hypothetical protein
LDFFQAQSQAQDKSQDTKRFRFQTHFIPLISSKIRKDAGTGVIFEPAVSAGGPAKIRAHLKREKASNDFIF